MMKGIIIIVLFTFIPFSTCISKEDGDSKGRVIFYAGYTKNHSSVKGFPDRRPQKARHAPAFNSDHAFIFSVGMKGTRFENGIYYGLGHLRKFSDIIEEEAYSVLFGFGGTKHVFGIYSSFYLSSLVNNTGILTDIIYLTAKMGGYYVPDENEPKSKPNGLGFNCYGGLGVSYYFFEKIGVFGEIGYDYYPKFENYVTMSKAKYKLGITIRI